MYDSVVTVPNVIDQNAPEHAPMEISVGRFAGVGRQKGRTTSKKIEKVSVEYPRLPFPSPAFSLPHRLPFSPLLLFIPSYEDSVRLQGD